MKRPELQVGDPIKHFRGKNGMVIHDPYLSGGNWWITVRWNDGRKISADVMCKTLSKVREARKETWD